MKKQIAFLIFGLGFIIAAITFTILITDNNVTHCESCGESKCYQKAEPVTKLTLVAR